MHPITQITSTTDDGYFGRHIMGLNIAEVNAVESITPDPRILMLDTLSQLYPCAAIVGHPAISSMGAANSDRLYAAIGNVEMIDVGLAGGTFYDRFEYGPAWYIPYVESNLWKQHDDDGDVDLLYVMSHDDALALLVGPTRKTSANDMPAFTNEHDWMTFLVDAFDLVVLTLTDGYYFSVYANTEHKLSMLDPAIASVVDLIASSTWYKTHAEALVWSGQSDCLTLE